MFNRSRKEGRAWRRGYFCIMRVVTIIATEFSLIQNLDLGEAGKELNFSDEDEDGDHDQFEMDQKSDNEENDDPSF